MADKIERVKAPNREAVEVLGATFEEGTPEGEAKGRWRQKFDTRAELLRYLQNGERYFHGNDGFGSEKRKNPA